MKNLIYTILITSLFLSFVSAQDQDKKMNSEKNKQITEMMNDTTMVNMMMEHMSKDDHMRSKMMQKMMDACRSDSDKMMGMCKMMMKDNDMHSMMKNMLMQSKDTTQKSVNEDDHEKHHPEKR
ncbi:MAG: hypothetical protein D8M58_17590 [Calditrichaeota bacterium]|nr:MAG: hypothetical protein DWQ03_01505 [Calditrichota bacterium]MBL1207220.1 hypothetical protein [Calditrichota bacterium]NOG47053.1 hypothetical protein [Calditrichota bacterium]